MFLALHPHGRTTQEVWAWQLSNIYICRFIYNMQLISHLTRSFPTGSSFSIADVGGAPAAPCHALVMKEWSDNISHSTGSHKSISSSTSNWSHETPAMLSTGLSSHKMLSGMPQPHRRLILDLVSSTTLCWHLSVTSLTSGERHPGRHYRSQTTTKS